MKTLLLIWIAVIIVCILEAIFYTKFEEEL